MKTVNILYTKKDDLLETGRKASAYPAGRILVQVFSGVRDLNLLEAIRSDIIDVFPGAAVIGATTNGEIINSSSIDDSVVVSVSFFETTYVRSHFIGQNDDLILAGQTAADSIEKFNPEARAIIIFGCGLKNGCLMKDIPFFDEIHKRLNRVIIAGGRAGVHATSETPCVFAEEGISREGFAMASLSGDGLNINRAYNISWLPVGKRMNITGVHGNTVFDIDDKSVREIYSHYLGIGLDDGFLFLMNEFPLMIERNGLLVTNPISSINKDGSFEYVQPLNLGEQVRFSFSDIGLQEEGAAELKSRIREYRPESVFVYSCASRKLTFGDNISVDMSALNEFPCSSGFFTFGEYFTDQSFHFHIFQQTMTVLTLSESESINEQCLGKNEIPEAVQSDTIRYRLLKILNHLMGKTTQELEEKNAELNELASRDSLTGLFNRRYFDETLIREIKANDRSCTPLSLLLLDVDFFKQFNDIYGHVAGDDCLRGIGHILGKEIRRPSDLAFRYGGEEFGCLLSHTDHNGAMSVAEKIRSDIEQLRIPHEGSRISDYVTVSLGVITLNCHPDSDPATLVSLCDEQLYEAKHGGRNRVTGRDISCFFENKEN